MHKNGIRQLMKRLDERRLLHPLAELCREYTVSVEDVLGTKRTKRIVECRHAFIAMLHLRFGHSHSEIGSLLHRDHGGVADAIRRHKERNAPKAVAQ